MKTYEEESKMLLNKMHEKELEIRKKYKGKTYSQLDGSPETREIEENVKWYKRELEVLKNKYKQEG